jgi:hypothetical protein
MDSTKRAALNDERRPPVKDRLSKFPAVCAEGNSSVTSGHLENVSPPVKWLFGDERVEIMADGSVWTFSDSLSPIAGGAAELPIVARANDDDCPTGNLPTRPGGAASLAEIVWHGPVGAVVVPVVGQDLRARFREARSEMAIALVRWLDSEPSRADSIFEIEQTRLIARAFGELVAAA